MYGYNKKLLVLVRTRPKAGSMRRTSDNPIEMYMLDPKTGSFCFHTAKKDTIVVF